MRSGARGFAVAVEAGEQGVDEQALGLNPVEHVVAAAQAPEFGGDDADDALRDVDALGRPFLGVDDDSPGEGGASGIGGT